MNILVVCVAGMSSSALMLRMREYIKQDNLPYKVGTCSSAEIYEYIDSADLVMLAPQLFYLFEEIKRNNPNKNIIMITPNDYGNQNIKAIIQMCSDDHNIVQSNKKSSRFVNASIKISQQIGTNRILRAISDGMLSLMPITIIGSIFVLIMNFPSTIFVSWLKTSGISVFLDFGLDATINCISLYTCFVVAYNLALRLKISGVGVGLNALICFFVLIAHKNGYLDATYLNASGIFYALFIAIVSTFLFAFIKQQIKKTPIKYISDNIAESFLAILPILINCLIFITISFILSKTTYGNLPTFIEEVIQTTLSLLVGNNILSALLLNSISNTLWFFGIHGGSIVGSLTDAIYIPLAYANITAYLSGLAIPFMISNQFKFSYIFGGAGSTLSLAILMTFFSKSKRLKQLGKLTLPTGIFFINEGLIFGMPIFLNPVLFLPFILITPICGLLTFYVMKIGLIPFVIGFQIPWTTPPIISGFIQGGIKLALWQAFMILLQMIMWYPYFKSYDLTILKQEYKR